MTMQEEKKHAGGKWEMINFIGVAYITILFLSFIITMS